MERAGRATGIAPSHLDDLRELVDRSGPVLTVVATSPEPVPVAIEAAVNDLRRSVSATALAELADDLADRAHGAFTQAAGVTMVADSDGILLVEHLDEAPRHPDVHVGAVPVLGSVVERRAADQPVVMVMVDRTGADLSWSAPLPAGATAFGETEIDGERYHVRKIRGGGWSHRRFQQRAEEAWEHVAGLVADAIVDHARTAEARLVVLGGDDRMVQLVRGRLPDAIAGLVREVPGSRSEDGSEADRDEVANRWLRTAVAEDTTQVLALFDQEKGQADRAADGIDATLEALRESRVDVLLIHDRGADDDRTACFVPGEPTLVTSVPAELEAYGADDVRVARLVDVAIRSALLTGADVRIVPRVPRLSEDIGAVLRW